MPNTSTPRAALLTCAELPALAPDDRPLLDELTRLGVRAEPLAWDDPAADWRAYGALVLRSTWDYHLKPAAFAAWLDRLEALGAPLWNPVPVARANADKSYLLRLAESGVPVVPTELVRRGAAPGLDELLERRGWDEAVVKPAVSASAFATSLVRRGRPGGQAALDALLARGDALVQPYLPEIEEEGEWSFVFLDGAFSHAALKRPRAGDFRVQEHLGGSVVPATPPPGLRARAEAVLAAVPPGLLYARVDGVRRGGELLLMELELLEPSLFLELAPGATSRFAAAIASRACRAPSPRR